MKKSLIALMLILACALVLTGCFQSPQAEQKKPEEKTKITEEATDETVTADTETTEVEGGGGVAADEKTEYYMVAPVKEKLENFEKYSHTFQGSLLINDCNDEAKDLNEKLVAGGIKEVQVYQGETISLLIYKTVNPGKLSKEKIIAISDPCAELGANQVLKVTDEYILWGYPSCTGGALPDPELQPELYEDFTNCLKVQNELADYLGLEK
ncbi:hypothetical protein JW911_01185 [Candidatus Peregrinibacteria bacterium]|nr:hypothetical protein [Candidatus Peregrinibacteria bacterium]